MMLIRTYMQSVVELYTDAITGEVNEAALAEDACNEYGIELEPDGSAPEGIYNQADIIARRHEVKTGARTQIHGILNHIINQRGSEFFTN